MPTATERLLGRTYRPPGYDPGDRPGYSPARSTRKRAVAADDVDIKVAEAPKPPPPAGASAWDAAKVASVVDACCEQCSIAACSELFLKHGVDGEVLESLLNAPAAELKLLGEGPGAACQAAATIAGYGARCKLHTRLKAYVEDHKKSLKAVEDARAALQLDADGREQLSRLAGAEPAYELLDPSLRISRPVKSDKTRQVVVPVYLTLMIKKLVASRSEADEDGISLVGTLIQRPLLYDLAKLPRCSGKTATPYFATRVNEGETSVEGCFDERKVASTSQSIHGGVWRATSTTFAANLPMKLYSVFSAHPFHIMATEVMIELTSFTSTTGHELRPSILCHVKDFRNLVRVRDYDSPSKMDEMKKWEIMNSSPTVEYEADGDGVDGKKPFYTPKLRVTFYLYRDARQPFLETIAPIIFALFANALNVVFSKQFEEFLANVVAIGFTLVLMVPRLSQNESFLATFQVNHIYVALIFLSLVVSAASIPLSRKFGIKLIYIKGAAIGLSVLSLFIPFMNLCIYRRLRRVLSASPHTRVANPTTFNGKEGLVDEPGLPKRKAKVKPSDVGNKKGSDVPYGDLRQFFSQPGKLEKGRKPSLRCDPRCIHESIRDYLNVYEAKRAKPWTQKGKRFICGFTKEFMMNTAEKGTRWITCGGRRARDKAIRDA